MGDLADFVRVRRLRIDPASCGIATAGQRRRVSGLCREELGMLSGLSADWIARLEQGRTTRLSRPAAERLARVLQLDAVEAEHMYVLCGQSAAGGASATHKADTLRQIVLSQGIDPAYLTDARGNVLIWNAAADLVLGPFERGGGKRSNTLSWMFLSSTAPERLPDWNTHAARMVAQFRFDYDRREKTADDIALITSLRARSKAFDRL